MWLTTLAVYLLSFVLLWNTETKAEICDSQACLDLSNKLRHSVDLTVDPCKDLYLHSCGGYLKETVLRDDQEFTNLQVEIAENLNSVVKKDLESRTLNGQLPVFQTAKDLYTSCMDIKSINASGLTVIKQDLIEFGSWPVIADNWSKDTFDWIRLIKKISEAGHVNDMIVSIDPDFNNRKVSQSIVTMGPPFFYVDISDLLEGLDNTRVKIYYNVFVKIALAFGADEKKAEDDMLEALLFEIELAKISKAEDYQDYQSLLSVTKIYELQKLRTLNWLNLLNSVLGEYKKFTHDDSVQLYIPDFAFKLGQLIKRTDPRVLVNYILLKVIIGRTDFLTDDLRVIMQELYSATDNSILETRQELCQSITTFGYPDIITPIVAANHVHKYFSEETRENVKEVLKPYKQKLIEVVGNVDWLNEVSRAKTLKKLKNTVVVAGYPKILNNETFLEDYFQKVIFSKTDFYSNANLLRRFRRYIQIRGLKKRYDIRSFKTQDLYKIVYPDGTGNPIANLIGIYSGILTDLYYDVNRPLYLNIATLAAAVGVYFSGIVNERAAQFDTRGNLGDLWDRESKEKYENKIKALVKQYSTFKLKELGLTLNAAPKADVIAMYEGAYTIGYKAFEDAIADLPEDSQLIGFEDISLRKLFWIVNAAGLCTKDRPELYKTHVQTDSDPPAEVVVNGILRNLENFAEDFECRKGSYMDPKKKFTFWS